jgi:transcription antitermination factor NusB
MEVNTQASGTGGKDNLAYWPEIVQVQQRWERASDEARKDKQKWVDEVENIVGKTRIYVWHFGESNPLGSAKRKLLTDDFGFRMFCPVGVNQSRTFEGPSVVITNRPCMLFPRKMPGDGAYFVALWTGVSGEFDELVTLVGPQLDRRAAELSPVERAILAIGAWELKHRHEIPYRVVINEAVELAKSYGGTDGYKFVNGVLDKMAAEMRAAEIGAPAAARNPSAVDAV